MVAYSFKRQFVAPILSGSKGGTIRAPRRHGHARPGEGLQLYTGMRTKHCRLIRRTTCIAVEEITLHFHARGILIGDRLISRNADLDSFARFDGFNDFDEMSGFWPVARFSGWHIRWLPLPDGALGDD